MHMKLLHATVNSTRVYNVICSMFLVYEQRVSNLGIVFFNQLKSKLHERRFVVPSSLSVNKLAFYLRSPFRPQFLPYPPPPALFLSLSLCRIFYFFLATASANSSSSQHASVKRAKDTINVFSGCPAYSTVQYPALDPPGCPSVPRPYSQAVLSSVCG